MDFVDEIKINRVNNVVLVSCTPSTAVAPPGATSSGADDDLTVSPPPSNDAQAWSGRRLEGTLVLTGHHTLVSSNSLDREEIWLLHSNIDTLEIRSPGATGATGNGAPSTPAQGRSAKSTTSAASRIGAMASAVANQYNLAMNNNAAASINGDAAPVFDSSISSAMGVVNSLSTAMTVPNFHIVIRCKNLQTLRLSFQNFSEAQKVFESLQKLSNVPAARTHLLYPFFYQSALDIVEEGWQIFDLEQEYSRLVLSLSDAWRISRVNQNFEVCPTYPRLVLVPKPVDDESIHKIAKFRQRARFPVLAYFHKPTQMVLLRSSQPLTGPNGNRRCKEDERFLNHSLPRNSRRGYVIDTRNANAVKAAQTKGGGIEPEAHYPQWKRIYCGMERPQAMMDSYSKMVDACGDYSGTSFLGKVNDSGWLGHVKELLHASCLVAQCIATEDACVLVHGTEGVDTTLQVTSLAQILLNPDARTLRGFQALITREWIAFGHPFRERHSRGPFAASAANTNTSAASYSSGGEAPSFLLFLDCVHQIHRHHPCAFEFTEEFLVEMFEHSYSSKFGTFLGNDEKDRVDNGFAKRTVSLWSHVNHPTILPQFINPLYEPNPEVIWASVAPQSLQVWYAVFCRWQLNLKPHQDALEDIKALKEKEREARTEVARLRKELETLEKEALEEGVLDVGFPTSGTNHPLI